MQTSAILSPCRTYRYVLTRRWADTQPGDTVAFIGLNPSTADETEDDPTIRRCIGFAKRLGYNSLSMLNLMAYRATNPQDVLFASLAGTDIVGPENDTYLMVFGWAAACRIACWGIGATNYGREEIVKAMFPGRMHSFGTTQAGFPRHPLYLPADATLFQYN